MSNVVYINNTKLKLMSAVIEEKYFKDVAYMRNNVSIQAKLWNIQDIYKAVSAHVSDENSEHFLYKSYIDTVIETTGIIKCIFACVHNGRFSKPRDPTDACMGMYDDDEERKLEMFKSSVIRSLFELDNARMKIAACLLALSNEEVYIEHFHAYSGGAHRSLGGGDILIEMYRCLHHIHSQGGELKYKFDNKDVATFDAMFCAGDNVADNEFVTNATRCFRGQIVEFDPAFTNHNKSKYAQKVVFVCSRTGEVMR